MRDEQCGRVRRIQLGDPVTESIRQVGIEVDNLTIDEFGKEREQRHWKLFRCGKVAAFGKIIRMFVHP